MGINYVDLSNKDEYKGQAKEEGSSRTALQRAAVARELLLKLIKTQGINSDRGVVLLSLQDGPLIAHEVIHAIKEQRVFDDIASAYVKMASTPRESLIGIQKLGQMKDSRGKSLKGAQALSAFYDGKMGEYFLNSSELLSEINPKQASLNVYFPKGRIQQVNSTLEAFDERFDITLGYAKDTSMGNPSVQDFYTLLKNIPRGEESKTSGLIRDLLYDKDNEFKTPLRAIEVVRSVLLGNIFYAKNGITYIELFKKLDQHYNKVTEHFDPSLLERDLRNDVTKDLVNQMKTQKILDLDPGTRIKIVKGKEWDEKSIFLKPWLDFYTEEVPKLG